MIGPVLTVFPTCLHSCKSRVCMGLGVTHPSKGSIQPLATKKRRDRLGERKAWVLLGVVVEEYDWVFL